MKSTLANSVSKLLLLIAISLATAFIDAAPRSTLPPVPDFTKGDKIGEKHDWNLGPTGARGWMWGWKTETTKARQIYVTEVHQGSPADGILEVGDVVLGVGEKLFDQDARHAFGVAISTAEAGTGKLDITRWRDDEVKLVSIQLPVLGNYSKRSPFQCEKSETILTQGCQYIAKSLERRLAAMESLSSRYSSGAILYKEQEITAVVDSLALLASGNPEYTKIVAQCAHLLGPKNIQLEMTSATGMASWGWGYINLFLCEYYLATGDKSVLPAIETYTVSIAKGQSFIGTWGHTMAWPEMNEGRLHGSLMGYGALNSAGIICHLSLVLGQKCGVDHDEVVQAIEKANQYIGFYAGKGAIPYGDHFPGAGRHDDNGKNSTAAIVFDLQNRLIETRFFTAMTVASHGERESGHTGNYFSFLWGSLGAQRAGDEAVVAFLKPQRWFYDLNRSWDGSFPYQGKADAGKGENVYAGWDCTSAFMLTYALPLKKLYITGRDTKESNALSGAKLAKIIDDGAGFHTWDQGMSYYERLSSDVLIKKLTSWSPAVRSRAAKALAKKPEIPSAITQLIDMLDSETLYTQYGACEGLGAMKERSKEAVPHLQKLLSEKDTWLRIKAATALTSIGTAAAPAIPDLLKLATTLDSNDPLQMTQRFLAFGLFDARGVYGQSGLLSKSVGNIDRQLLYKVVQQLLKNPDGRTRGTVESVYRSLSFKELEPLFPAILEAVETPSPSGVMFANDIRLSGLELLAKYQIKEGMELCLKTLEIHKWGKKRRIAKCLEILATYGTAAKPMLPKLYQLKKDLQARPEANMLKESIAQVDDIIKEIENSTKSVKLRSILNNESKVE